MSDRTRFTLHYGGKKFDISAEEADNLQELLTGTYVGLHDVRCGPQRVLSISIGPGVPIAIEVETTSSSARVW